MKSTTIEDDRPEPPKQPSPAYFNFAADIRAEFKSRGENIPKEEIKVLWDDLKKDKKDKYDKAYQEQWEQFKKKKAEYQEEYGKIERKPRKSKEKMPAQTSKRDDLPPYPKQPSNAFFRFAAAKRKEKLSTSEIKALWDTLDKEDKQQYQDAYLQDKETFDEEKKEWESKYGKRPKKEVVEKDTKSISKAEKAKGGEKSKGKDHDKDIHRGKEVKNDKKDEKKGKKVEESGKREASNPKGKSKKSGK